MTTKINDTDIGVEQALQEDDQGEFCRALSDFFRQHQQALKRTLDRGVSREDFPAYQALIQASGAAAEATEKIWKSLSGQS